jgi:hypothetical protein
MPSRLASVLVKVGTEGECEIEGQSWFGRLQLVAFSDGHLCIKVPNKRYYGGKSEEVGVQKVRFIVMRVKELVSWGKEETGFMNVLRCVPVLDWGAGELATNEQIDREMDKLVEVDDIEDVEGIEEES